MSEDTTTVAEEQPEANTPDEGTGTSTPEINWEERYKEAQAWGTKQSQEAAQYRQQVEALRTDPDAQRKFLEELGLELEDDTPYEDDLPADPTAAQLAEYEKRLAAIEQANQQAAEQRQLEAAEQHFDRAFTQLGSKRGSPLSEEERNAVIGMALTMPAGEDQMPQVEAAYEALEAMWEARQQAWKATKQPSHRVSPNGATGTEAPDLDDEKQRQAWMAQRLADLNAAE